MSPKRYLVLLVLAMSLLAGCGVGASEPTSEPFARYKAQDVLDAMTKADLSVENPQRVLAAADGVPLSFNDRYVFQILVRDQPPNRGQILVFNSPEAMKKWKDYITTQKASSATRRDWLFVFERKNVLLQIDPDLTNDEADQYRKSLESLP